MLSLQELCLNAIVRKFELFYNAYTISKDNNLQRNFHFLQRWFSNEVLCGLFKSCLVKEEYLEFLINEHIESIEYYWLDILRCRFSFKELFLRLPNLRKIGFNSCDDEALKYLAKFCPKLTEIYFFYPCSVTDRGIGYLCKNKNGLVPCPELKVLFIRNTNVTDRGIQYLIRNVPSIEVIDYENIPLLIHSIHEEELQEFKTVKSYNLVELSFLRSCGLSKSKSLPKRTDILKICLTACPKLESLYSYISDKEQLDLLTKIHHLSTLHLEFPTSFDIDSFLNVRRCRLTTLSVTQCTMSISALGLYLPNLENFSAERVIFSDADKDGDLKVTFSSLSSCEFKDIEPFSNKAICFLLSSSPELRSVKIHNCTMSLELKKEILLLGKRASFIDLFGVDVVSDIEFIEDILLKCTSLHSMWLEDKFLSEWELSELGICQKLDNLASSLTNKPGVYFHEVYTQ